MQRIKYFGSYHGPSYGSMDQEYMDAYSSLEEAKQAMRNRQGGYDLSREYRENPEGHLVPWKTAYTAFPCTTNSDYMDLCVAHKNDDEGSYYVGEVFIRLSIGERGGIIAQKWS